MPLSMIARPYGRGPTVPLRTADDAAVDSPPKPRRVLLRASPVGEPFGTGAGAPRPPVAPLLLCQNLPRSQSHAAAHAARSYRQHPRGPARLRPPSKVVGGLLRCRWRRACSQILSRLRVGGGQALRTRGIWHR